MAADYRNSANHEKLTDVYEAIPAPPPPPPTAVVFEIGDLTPVRIAKEMTVAFRSAKVALLSRSESRQYDSY
jgi:hypothetical protein